MRFSINKYINLEGYAAVELTNNQKHCVPARVEFTNYRIQRSYTASLLSLTGPLASKFRAIYMQKLAFKETINRRILWL